MRIINLTQHPATPEQFAAGVFEPADKEAVKRLLTCDEPPTEQEIEGRAVALASIARVAFPETEGGPPRPLGHAMIGGAGWLMGALEQALHRQAIRALHSFTRREAVEEPQPDGSVKKVSVFRHVGFVGRRVRNTEGY